MILCTLLLILSSAVMAQFRPLDAQLTNYEYPFPVNFHEIKIGEEPLQMAYMMKGHEGKKKGTVLLLHGKNFSGAYWEKTALDLSRLGYEVIIPDQIGFGKSSRPNNFPYTFQLLSTLTREILQKHKIKNYIVIGHSMGGMLATRMALMFPQEVSKLVLVNPIGLEDWKTMVSYKDIRELYENELKSNESSIREYQKSVYFDGKWKPEYEKNIEILVGQTLHKDFPKVAWNSALTADMIFTQPVVYEFKNLTMPTLLLLGTRDRTAIGRGWATPEMRDKMGRYDLLGKTVIKDIPKGKLVELNGLGHMPQVEDYTAYWKAIQDFLK